MKKNVGSADSILRFAIAAIIIILYATGVVSGGWGIALLVFAGIAILTGIFKFCPLYVPLGFSSCKKCCDDKNNCESK